MGRSKKWDTHQKWLEREDRRREMGLLDAYRAKKAKKAMTTKESATTVIGRSVVKSLQDQLTTLSDTALQPGTVVHSSGGDVYVVGNGEMITWSHDTWPDYGTGTGTALPSTASPSTSPYESGLDRWINDKKSQDKARRLMEEAERLRQYQYQRDIERVERELRKMEEEEEAKKRLVRPGYWVDGREMEQYRDPEGRVMWRPKGQSVAEDPEPEPKIEHKAGHFPIQWMIEGSQRAKESDFLIHIEACEEGVDIVGHHGEEYAQYRLEWVMMDKAEINPLIPAIENVERQLRVVASLRKADAA